MSEQLSRTITFDEIQAGDAIRSTYTAGDVRITREGFVARRAVSPGRRWYTHDGNRVVDGRETDLVITLMSRPIPRGPAWDGKPGTLWVDEAGTVLMRTFASANQRSYAMFRYLDGQQGVAHIWSDPGCEAAVDSLVPYVPPPSELDTLRQNVIDAAVASTMRTHGETTVCTDPLCVAVRALRGAEASS